MASEDVIELGSSDDEAEPAPKKLKPMPNAMVIIPNKLPGVTITPTKSKATSVPKGLVGKPITVTKVTNVAVNPITLLKINSNGRTVKTPQKQNIKLPQKQNFKLPQKLNIKSPQKVTIIKPPQNFIKLPNKVTFNPLNINASNASRTMVPLTYLKNPIQVAGPRPITTLPPSITIKRTIAPPKHSAAANIRKNVKKKKTTAPNRTANEVLTVELDDEEVASPNATGPQWYIRPEEQEKEVEPEKIEEKNNTEPEPSKMIEITIEDSPVKLALNKRTHEVGAELAITIDDSPVKTTLEKNVPASGSDDETRATEKVPHSKKKLEYPKNHGSNVGDTLEIEIEPIDVNGQNGPSKTTRLIDNIENISDLGGNKNMKEAEDTNVEDNVVLIEESPAKPEEIVEACTPKKKSPVRLQHTKNIKELEIVKQNYEETGEFHPVYQSFIDLCFELENSDDMKKIVDKKIKAYYKQVPTEYTESEQFIDMVSGKILSMKAGPEKMYLYIKDIVDELNLQRKVAKSQTFNEEVQKEEADKFLYGENSDFDSKRQRQIRKLEKTLKKLHRAIQKLEEQEVDFDDDEDSVYLLTERYKERMVRVHAKFCQLTNTKMPSEPRVQIDARPGQPSGPAKRLEKWINKKVPIGTPLPFPDFHDVLRCVKEANIEDKLGWNDVDIMEEARDLFIRCGKKLQRRRQENEWRLAASRISVDIDPAENSDDLKKKLERNKMLATKKETDVFNKYANKQNELKLVAEEIGDKEADESPVESDEEFVNEDTSLEDSEKRKERLKRLLQEKSKKVWEEKENQPEKESANSANLQESIQDTNKDENKVNESEKDITKPAEQVKQKDTTDIPESEKKNIIDDDTVQSVSDDSNKIESDIDELNLLQKLHSENEINSSTLDSSDSDSSIVISDTLPSSSDNKRQQNDDIISIENSSYSESEINKNYDESIDSPKIISAKTVVEEAPETNIDTECSVSGVVFDKSNNDEYNDAVENILLASSDEENDANKDPSPDVDNLCVNLKDDSISIGETVIGGTEPQKNSVAKKNNTSEETVAHKDTTNNKEATLVENIIIDRDKDSNENMVQQLEVEKNKEKSDDSSSVELMEVVQNEVTADIEVPGVVSTDNVNADTATVVCKVTNLDSNRQDTDIDSTRDEPVGLSTETNEVTTTSPFRIVEGLKSTQE